MAKRVQHIGHPAAAADQFTGLDREITLDTSLKTVRVHDGTTKGGFSLALASLSNVPDATTVVDGKMTAPQVVQLDAATAAIVTNAADIVTNAGDIVSGDAAVTAAFIAADVVVTNAYGVADNLRNLKTANLSDVANAATARTNLGLGSLATQNTVNNLNWAGEDLGLGNGGTGASNAIGAQENLDIFAGSAVSAGVAVRLPSGWSVVKSSTGLYTITHNLGNTDYHVIPTCRNNTGFYANLTSFSTNSMQIATYNISGAKSDSTFQFILIQF